MSTIDDEQLLGQYVDKEMPPHALPSESAILGAILLRGPACAHPLITKDFYKDWNASLFQLVMDLYARHPGVEYLDPIAVKDELFRRGRPFDATPMFLLYDDAIQRCAHPTFHVERILDAAEARMAQGYGQKLAQCGADTDRADFVMAEMRDGIAAIRARAGVDGGTVGTRLAELIEINRLANLTGSAPAMSTGLIDLDRLLNGGLRPGTFNVLGARPGVGKSLLAGAIAAHVGSTQMASVLYVTMELTAAEVTNRLVSNIANVDLTRLQNPEQLTMEDDHAQLLAQEQVADWPVHIEDGSKSIGQIEAAAKRHLGNAPAGLLIVDYLGRIREEGGMNSRERHVAQCASRLTDLASDLSIPVLCVVSFSRDSVKRGGPPRMDDIRDSGNVESDAHTVMLMWAPDSQAENEIELIVDKNRYGDTGSVRMVKQGNRGRLVNASRAWAP